MAKCKHENAAHLADDGDVLGTRWCEKCGALFIRFETDKGHVSKRPKWLLPKSAKP